MINDSIEHNFYEPEIITIEQAASVKYPCVIIDNQTAKFWCKYSIEEDSFVLLSKFPYPYPDKDWAEKHPSHCPQHLIDAEISNVGLHYVLIENFNQDIDKCEKWMEENNLKPNVPFQVMVKIYIEKISGYFDPEDFDLWFETQIIDIEKQT